MSTVDPAPLDISLIEKPKFRITLNGEVRAYDPFKVTDEVVKQTDTPLHEAVLKGFGLKEEEFPPDSNPRQITLVLWTKLNEFVEGLDASKKYLELVQRNSSSAPK